MKSSSEQTKKELIAKGKVDKEHAKFYVDSLTKYDSVNKADYAKI